MKTMLLVLLLCAVPVRVNSASVGEETARLTQVSQLEEGLDEEESAVTGEMRLDGSYDARGALARLWDRFLALAEHQLRQELRFALALLAIAFFGAFAAALRPDQKTAEHIQIAVCCTAALLLAGSVDSVVSQGAETLTRLSDYAKLSMPAFFSTVAVCGAAVSASVRYAAVTMAAELYMTLAQRLILPAIYAYLAIAVSSSIFDNAILKTALRCAKWCAVTAMTLLTTVFCTYISLSGIISGSADAAAVKATKTVVASVLPVVGGIVSDSASTMLAAASMIKNSAGVFCLVAVCVLCCGSFALLSVKMLVLNAVSAVAEMAGGERLSRLLGNVGTAFGMLLGLIGSFGVLLFLSVMSGIRMVNP